MADYFFYYYGMLVGIVTLCFIIGIVAGVTIVAMLKWLTPEKSD